VVYFTDRAAPRAVGSFSVDPAANESYFTNIIQTDNAILVGRARGYYAYSYGGQASSPRYFYDVIDLADPAAPVVASRFEVPEQIAGYGWGWFGVAGCTMDMGWGWYGGGSTAELADGDIVLSQHAEPVPGSATDVKYYLDRIDVSDPYNPRMLEQVNIPGTVIHFNAETNELITLDYGETIEVAESEVDCFSRGYSAWFDGTPARCRVLRRSLNSLVIEGDRAVRKSELALDEAGRTSNIAVSDSRIFYTTSESYWRGGYLESASANGTSPPPPVETAPVTLESLRLEQGQLVALPSLELRRLPRNNAYYYGQLYARDERVFEIFDNNVTVVDTIDPEAPARLTRELPNWGCQSLEVADDTAYCASGQRGVEVIDLSTMR
jgi:hypothetical protein